MMVPVEKIKTRGRRLRLKIDIQGRKTATRYLEISNYRLLLSIKIISF
jgi:hypothetical protein